MSAIIRGTVFVGGDNIDTDQIIPAQYLNLVPTIAEEYVELGSRALSGLPDAYPRLVPEGQNTSAHRIVIAGRNFGCGSSREHAPVSLGAAGIEAIVAESFARIFFRNCIATGELYPVETPTRLCECLQTGDEVVLDLDECVLTLPDGSIARLAPLGDAQEVIDAGGLFAFARAQGMIAATS